MKDKKVMMCGRKMEEERKSDGNQGEANSKSEGREP
jgi:hypothetical protein